MILNGPIRFKKGPKGWKTPRPPKKGPSGPSLGVGCIGDRKRGPHTGGPEPF